MRFVAGPLRFTVEERAVRAGPTASFIRNVEAIAGGPMGGVREETEIREHPARAAPAGDGAGGVGG